MTVVNDDRSNSVVVFGTSDDIRLVRELVDKLDIVLAQVRIEVVIAEVTLDDNHESGISALGLVVDGDKLVGFSGFYGDALSITNGAIIRPGTSGRMDLAAEIAIGTTPRTRNNSIITVPAIVTSHGKQAKVFSGESRPVVTGILQSPGGVGGIAQSSQVTQLEIGTTLTVTPFIGIDGSVQLDLVQAVEDVTGEVQVDQNTQYIIGKRETTNYVTAKSGEIIVLGGFRKDSNIKERDRLGPIPILGDIFGPRRRSKNRSELIFFLRPTVLQNDPAIDNVEPLKQIEEWPTRDELKRHIDPGYKTAPEPSSVLDKILPR
jgi:general secretion pathway protein D